MRKRMQKMVSFLVLGLFVFFIPTDSFVGAEEVSPPQTGLEIRNDGSWTTIQEELDFLKKLDEMSKLVKVEVYGESAEGRPMHLVKVGKKADASHQEIAAGRTMFIVGTFHGNEPSGREMALQTMRDLAFTEEEDMLQLLDKATIIFLPTVNPDGREANRRRNGDNYDINRDGVRLITPEGQTLARIHNEFQPDLILDAHERMGGPNMSVLGNKNRMVDPDLIALNDEVIKEYMFKDLDDAGFEYTYYPSSDASLPTNTRSVSGFRHSIGILTEGSWLDEPLERVDAQLVSVQAILRFYHERFEEIGVAVEDSRVNHQARGAVADEPFYLEGSVDIDPEDIDELAILDPPPQGYVINEKQKTRIDRQIELFSIELEKIDGGYFITMDQEMMAIIPYIMDENARTKLINGERVMDETNPEDLVAPSEPVGETYTENFSTLDTGLFPKDWTAFWGESQWKVKDAPNRIEHVVTDGDTRRLLTWDKVGEVHGDVEVAALVRTDQEGELFQVHLNAYGTTSSNDSYYLDVKSQNGVNEIQISRVIGSLYRSLDTEPLGFTVDVDTWYNIVFKREGTTLMGKIWEYGKGEPDEWHVEVDDVYMEFGRVGVGHETSGVINDWGHFSVGTYGQEAERASADLMDEIDKSVLERRIEQIEAEDLKAEDHLDNSWENFQEALENAKNVLADEGVTQEVVDEAVSDLYSAYTSLSAQFKTDFSDYDVGDAPHDWSTLWRESNWKVKDDPNRLVHQLSDDGSGRRVLTWDQPGTITGDVEIYTLVKKTSATTSGVMFQLHLQASGIASNENSYYLDVTNSGNIRINRNRTGGFSSLKSTSIQSSSDYDTWYEVVFKREGNTLLGKAWRYGEEEPEKWQVEVEDDSFFNGKVGLGHVTNSVHNEFAFFSVGTADAEAPRAPADLLVDTTPLEVKVNEIHARELVESEYNEETWNRLTDALEEAERMIADSEGLTQAAILALIIEIEESYSSLQSANNQFSTDFSEYETGIAPEDWSTLWRESDWTVKAGPNRIEHNTEEGSGRRVLTWDQPGHIAGNVEIYTVVRKSHSSSGVMFQLHLQGTGLSGSESSYYLDFTNSNRIRINRNRNGGFSSLGSNSIPTASELDTWYEVLFKREGSMLYGKVWRYGEDEPEGWQIEIVDENFSNGKVGLGHVTTGIINDFAFFSVGVGEEEALRAPADLLDDGTEIDKTALQAAVDAINDETLEESDYTPASWEIFQTALTQAEDVLANEEATQEEVDEALAALTAAHENLTEAETPPVDEVDKTDLQAKIDEMIEAVLEESAYTEATWTAFTAALDHAIAVAENDEATQVEVDDALAGLIVAYDNLEEIEAPPVDDVDKSALEQTLNQIASEALDSSLYTEASWSVFTEAFEGAENVLADADATQEEVDQALTALNLAYENLTLIDSEPGDDVDKTALQDAMDRIINESLDEGMYTETSWEDLQSALQVAAEVIENDDATQEEVNGALDALNAAYAGLTRIEEPPVEADKTALQAAVDAINEENLDESVYTEATWAIFAAVLAHAEDVLANEDASQEVIDDALAELQAAHANLVKIEEPPVEEVDKTDLQAMVDQINGENLDETLYTDASWASFAQMLAEAEDVLVHEEADQEAVDQALANLQTAYANLTAIETPPVDEVDRTALQALADQISSEGLEESDYTTGSWNTFQTALEQAQAILALEEVTQDEIDAALTALTSAYDDLVVVEDEETPVDEVDKTALQDAVNEIEAEGLDETAYTDESWTNVANALVQAQSVLADPAATEGDVEQALEQLLEARANLANVPVEEDDVEETPTPTEPEEESNEHGENELPSTSTPIYNMMLFGTILVALGVGLFIVRKRRI